MKCTPFVRAFVSCTVLASTLGALGGCGLPEIAGGSSSTETGEKVSLTGRVLNGSRPLPGVAVSLARAGLHDTTDATGTYRLIGRVSAPRASASSPDTLRFELNGGMITRRGVTDWNSGMPDLQIVQRGFSGSLLPSSASIGRLVAVLKGDGILQGDSVTTEMYHNAAASNYSGFLYFPAPGDSIRNYSVRVDAFGPQGGLVGRSQTVPFTSVAGNISLPAFDPGNLAPAKTNAP